MESRQATCPSCKHTFRTAERRAKCPKCGGAVTAPSAAPSATRAAEAFYQAAITGDTAAAATRVASGRRADLAELLGEVTREGQLQRVSIVRARQWAEHGAVCEVRRYFRSGDSDQVRMEMTRESGDWKLAGVPERSPE